MSDKKQIDKLFKEQFKDFESAPNDAVWDRIEVSLHEKKRKRRVIPIWWQLGGVAALLLLLLTVGNIIFSPESEKLISPETIVDGDSSDENVINAEDSIGTRRSEDNSVVTNERSIEESNALSQESKSNIKTPSSVKERIEETPKIVSNDNTQDKTLTEKNDRITNEIDASNSIAEITKKDSSKNSVTYGNETNTVANDVRSDRKELPVNEAKTTDIPKDDVVVDNSNLNKNNKSSEINSEDPINKDSALLEKNSIEEAIAQTTNEKEKEDVEKLNRWSVSPNVAPVYFNTLGKGSSIGEDFINNTKQGEVNMSYGISGSYALNDKIKIRAGINKVELGYNTSDVIIYGGSDASFASTSVNGLSDFSGSSTTTRARDVNLSMNSNNTSILSADNIRLVSAPEIISSQTLSSLDQRLGFIEIPLEMEYSLLDTKFGLNLIGGFSTLLLDKNNVYSVVDGERTLLGEATNLNDTSFSANFGLGLNYSISEKFKLNLEPTFKYQMNTFNNTSGDFRPYFIGVYSGISFKF